MFCIIDREKNMTPIKSGFHTASQANNWAKKNLPKDKVRMWGDKHAIDLWHIPRYLVVMK